MAKPTIIVLAAGVMVLAVILWVLVPRDRGDRGSPPPPPPEAQGPVAGVDPPVSVEAAQKVAPPSPARASGQEPGRPRVAAPATAPSRLDEAALMARLHDLAASDPPLSLKLAREGIARFPGGPSAPEFEWNVVKALANMDRYQEAKEEARRMLEKYPGNPLTEDVERHVLNPPPNPSNAASP